MTRMALSVAGLSGPARVGQQRTNASPAR